MIADVVLLLCLLQTGWAMKLSAQQAMMGRNVNIPCSFTVKSPPLDRRYLLITWYFQGKEILSVRNTAVTSTDPRMSYTSRAENGIADLSISEITITDGGIYRCSTEYRSEKEEKEIRLDVQAPPQINITDNVVVKNIKGSLRSVISGFYPVDIDIKWLRGGEILDKVITEKPQRDPDGTYSVRSSVMITPTEEDRERTFSCKVQHESLPAPLQKDFQLVYGAIPSVHITSQAFKLNVQQNLVCKVYGFYPESITVNWYLNDTLVEKARTRRISSSAVESVYPFTPTEKNWGMELGCEVEHGTFTTPHMEKLLVQGTDLKARYKLFVVLSSVALISIIGALIIVLLFIKQRRKSFAKVRDIKRSSGVTFSLDVDHFSPEDITVSWEVIQPPSNTQPRSIHSTIIKTLNQNRTFNATSTCESLRGMIQEDGPYVVRAVVEHSTLKHPKRREWRSDDKDNRGFLARPEVGMVQIPKLFVNKHAQLQCTVSQFYPDDLTVEWLWKDKKKRELPINNSERYTISNSRSELQPDKTFTRTALLEFTPLLEDVGSEVICRVFHPSLKEPKVTTTGPLQVMAKPELQQPIQLSVTDTGDVVGCVTLLNFNPQDIEVSWTCNTLHYKDNTPEKVIDNQDGTFSLDSQYKIPGKLLESKQFIIKVTWKHETMEKPEYSEISIQDQDFPWRPRIEDMSPLILQVGQETKVTCKISSYFPGNLRVTWLEKKGETLTDLTNPSYNRSYNRSYNIPDIRHERMADNTYQCSPSLSFTPRSEEDLEFICRVEHPSLKHPIEQSTGPPRINVPPQEQKVVTFTPNGTDLVLCSLSLMKFYPQNIDITWSCKEHCARILPSTKKIIQTDNEKTFDAISECKIPWKHFMSSVRVTWKHDSLKEAGYRDLSITDLPWRLVIEEIDKLPILENTEANLQYKISQCPSPSELSVTWLKKEKNGNLTPLPNYKSNSKYRQDTSSPQLHPDNTYSCTTSLLFTPTLPDDQGSEFICRVEHPSLRTPIERRTGPLQVCACPRNQDPIQWFITDRRETALCLRLHRFYPQHIKIKWTCTCGRLLISEEKYYENNLNSAFNVTSKCIVPQEHMTHSNPTIKMTWKHVTMTDPESREVCIRDRDFPWRPEVTELSNPVLLLGQPVTVQCEISNFFPNNLTVTWFVKERGSQEYVDLKRSYKTIFSPLQYSDSGFSYSTSVQFTPSLSFHHGVMFMCKVNHPSLEHPIERVTEPLFIPSAPEVTDSVKITPCESEEVLCSVRLEKFFPKRINLTWTFGGEVYSRYTPKKTLLVDDDMETFCAVSECRIPCKLLQFPVRVTWKHASIAEPQYEELPGPDYPWCPQIEALDTPYLILNTESKIQCRISGYFPNDLTMNWFKEEKKTRKLVPVTNDINYKIPNLNHQRQPDNTYSCIASLHFTPTRMDHRPVFICKVRHSSLKEPKQERIGPLQIVAAPEVTDSVKITPCEYEEVLCSVRLEKFFPKQIDFNWTFGGEEHSRYTPKKTLLVDDDMETFGVISECKIPWNLLKFPVRVIWTHESKEESQCQELSGPDFPWCPQIEALDTPYLILNTESKLKCRISGYFPKNLTVSWFIEEEETGKLVPVTSSKNYKILNLNHQRQPDNTYSCIASLHFTPTRMDHRPVFICKIEHPSLKEAKQERIGPLQIVELLGRPNIDSLDAFMLDRVYKIECKISGYSPNKLTVTWLKKKGKNEFVSITKGDRYNIPDIEHHKQPNSTYSCTASLSYEPKNDGSEFMCRVEHPSLDQPIEKCTQPLQKQQPDTNRQRNHQPEGMTTRTVSSGSSYTGNYN